MAEVSLRDDLRIALRRRGLPVGELKQELVEGMAHGTSAEELSEVAAGALLFIWRRSGSRPDGFALSSDESAYLWIAEACEDHRLRLEGQGLPSGAELRQRTPGGATSGPEALGKERAAHRRRAAWNADCLSLIHI